jgi:low affinity Fe/Cu permease
LQGTCELKKAPTVRVFLVWVEHKPTVVPVIWNTIIVIIRVAGIALAVVVMVSLVGVGDVWAVVLVVLVAVIIYVLIVVTLVSNEIIVLIDLGDRAASEHHEYSLRKHRKTRGLD